MDTKKTRKAIYSGTFDPITNGHMDIIKRALKVYDEIIIAVADSQSKEPMFSINSRVRLIQAAINNIEGASVKSFDTLLVDFAKKENVYNIIRGLRTNTDFEYELQMSYANSSLDPDIDTIFFMPCQKNSFVSSSVVRELIRFKANYSKLIPTNIQNEIKEEICML